MCRCTDSYAFQVWRSYERFNAHPQSLSHWCSFFFLFFIPRLQMFLCILLSPHSCHSQSPTNHPLSSLHPQPRTPSTLRSLHPSPLTRWQILCKMWTKCSRMCRQSAQNSSENNKIISPFHLFLTCCLTCQNSLEGTHTLWTCFHVCSHCIYIHNIAYALSFYKAVVEGQPVLDPHELMPSGELKEFQRSTRMFAHTWMHAVTDAHQSENGKHMRPLPVHSWGLHPAFPRERGQEKKMAEFD